MPSSHENGNCRSCEGPLRIILTEKGQQKVVCTYCDDIYCPEISETELNQGNKTSIEVESATTETEQKIPERIMDAPPTDPENSVQVCLDYSDGKDGDVRIVPKVISRPQ